jgi:hypothetical protein
MNQTPTGNQSFDVKCGFFKPATHPMGLLKKPNFPLFIIPKSLYSSLNTALKEENATQNQTHFYCHSHSGYHNGIILRR